MKILIVDDTAVTAEVIGICLSIEWPEAEIIKASTGREAISLVESEKPDMILLDLGLPDMDGLEVLDLLTERTSAPIIVVSGRIEQEIVEDSRGRGASDFIAKPFSFNEMLTRTRILAQRVTAAHPS